uniref:Uncharacterized protein LOC111108499 isoform X2 n=1 Tax=Crassostrea virginica TaxID=6565 RepID=A0A8B8BAW0_CRAVI|nr:uncharacterized protein LOC111108499 isoform X2 [Crassostrea virginica]
MIFYIGKKRRKAILFYLPGQEKMHSAVLISALCLCIGFAAAIDWPYGTYSMITPRGGCPTGWKWGWRYQDNEDTGNLNSVTSGHHFNGFFFDDTITYYCSKTSSSGSGSWPSGNYCIMRYGSSCPSGFSTGDIYWDDEDTDNMNGEGGYLPSGTYSIGTRINYCCRNDGSYYSSISLPTDKPFYLLRYTSSCQWVSGMSVSEEIIKTDDEDTANANSVSGSHPMDTGSGNHRLHYCYYAPY